MTKIYYVNQKYNKVSEGVGFILFCMTLYLCAVGAACGLMWVSR